MRIGAVGVLACAAAGVAGTDDLATTLQRAGAYVRQYEGRLAVVVGEEDYVQERTLPTTSEKRHMRSDVLFSWLGNQRVWLWVRNATEVDGTPVPDSHDRFDRIAKDQNTDMLSRLRALRRESARFNIGDVYRDFNDPTYALLFLEPSVQRRFAFSASGREKIGALETLKIDFVEKLRPTVIRNGAADVPAAGTTWIAADGTVTRTRLRLSVSSETMSTANQHVEQQTDAQIEVEYARGAAIDMWLPARMEERYVRTLRRSAGRTLDDLLNNGGTTLERIRCTAIYSGFRRFETTARIVGG